jgi:hypothetical protein
MITLLYALASLLAFPGTLVLMYVWLFTGPSIFDGLPAPDKKSEDSKEE